MIITNIDYLPKEEIIEHLGMVSGSTVRAKHFGGNFFAGIRNLFGGELKGHTELLNNSREEAIKRMTESAESIGANAIINVRFSTSSITSGAAESYVYGTAVKV